MKEKTLEIYRININFMKNNLKFQESLQSDKR